MPPAIEKPNPLPPFTRSMSTLFGEAGGRFRLIFNFTIFPAFFNASTAVACVTLTTFTSFTYCLPKFFVVCQINKEKEIVLNIVTIFFFVVFLGQIIGSNTYGNDTIVNTQTSIIWCSTAWYQFRNINSRIDTYMWIISTASNRET